MSILKKKSVGASDKVETLIGKDTLFKGTITANGIIRIDGQMEGEISTKGDIVIGESGKVLAEIKARGVAVAGRLEGNVESSERLEIRSSGILIGNIKTNMLTIDEGAVFSGSCEMEYKDKTSKEGK